MSDLAVYLNTLFDGLEGLVYSPVKGESWETHWFEWPNQKVELESHILNRIGDVYISPAVYSDKRPTKDSIKRLQTVWVEFDGAEQIDFKDVPLPNLIVQTSFASHVHCYWRIDATNLTTVEDINRRLTFYLQADSSGWDATQLLRPPLTVNHKHSLPVTLVNVKEGNHATSSFTYLPSVSAAPAATVNADGLIPVGAILSAHQLPLQLIRMVKKETPVEPYRSSFLARLANELAEEELSHLEIVSLLKEADTRIEKYSGRSDQLLRLSQIADYAVHKHVVADEVLVYTPEYILTHVEAVQWILPNWLHTTGQLIISSAPGAGKTQLCLQLSYCLVTGIRFLGLQVAARQRVLFMSLEMDRSSLKWIMEKQRNEWETLPEFQIIDESSTLTYYENLIAQHESTVVIIDSLTELFDDSVDNPNAEARRVMRWCRKVRRRYGVAVILIHHNRKATEGNRKPRGLADLAGSFQFGKDSDTVLQLWEDHKGLELSLAKARFGPKDAFLIERSENLWYRRKGDSNREQPVRDDKKGDGFDSGFGNRHRD